MKQTTLILIKDQKNILLAMKKRGLGEGLWNGVGGKAKPGEEIEDAAIRECQEEIGVTPLNLVEVGRLDFFHPKEKKDWDQQVVVYMTDKWDGTPKESEEMAPKWFEVSSIPYHQMWEDDNIWLPEVLKGKYVVADFHFDNNQSLIKHSIEVK